MGNKQSAPTTRPAPAIPPRAPPGPLLGPAAAGGAAGGGGGGARAMPVGGGAGGGAPRRAGTTGSTSAADLERWRKEHELKEFIHEYLSTMQFDPLLAINHKNPLAMAVEGGFTEHISSLIKDSGIDLNVRNEGGETPMHVATRKADTATLSLLIHHDAQLDGTDNNGSTPLIVAVRSRRQDVVKYILKHKPDINASDYRRMTATHYALANRDAQILKLLLDRRPLLHTCNERGSTPLHEAVRLGDVNLVDAILKARFFTLLVPAEFLAEATGKLAPNNNGRSPTSADVPAASRLLRKADNSPGSTPGATPQRGRRIGGAGAAPAAAAAVPADQSGVTDAFEPSEVVYTCCAAICYAILHGDALRSSYRSLEAAAAARAAYRESLLLPYHKEHLPPAAAPERAKTPEKETTPQRTVVSDSMKTPEKPACEDDAMPPPPSSEPPSGCIVSPLVWKRRPLPTPGTATATPPSGLPDAPEQASIMTPSGSFAVGPPRSNTTQNDGSFPLLSTPVEFNRGDSWCRADSEVMSPALPLRGESRISNVEGVAPATTSATGILTPQPEEASTAKMHASPSSPQRVLENDFECVDDDDDEQASGQGSVPNVSTPDARHTTQLPMAAVKQLTAGRSSQSAEPSRTPRRVYQDPVASPTAAKDVVAVKLKRSEKEKIASGINARKKAYDAYREWLPPQSAFVYACGGSHCVPAHIFDISPSGKRYFAKKQQERKQGEAMRDATPALLQPHISILDQADAAGQTPLSAASLACQVGEVRHNKNVQLVIGLRMYLTLTDEVLV